MTSFSPRVRAALACVVALTAATGIVLALRDPGQRKTDLSEAAAAQSADVPEVGAEDTTTSTEAPTTSTSTTAPPATTVPTTPRTTSPPTTTPPPTPYFLPPRGTPEPGRTYVDCQFVDNGNQLGQRQYLQVIAPTLAGQRVTFSAYFPTEEFVPIDTRGWHYADLDAAGKAMINFPTTAEMVGQPVRVEVQEDLINNHQNDRYCNPYNFVIPPPS